MELTKTSKGENGYIVTCRIGTRYCNSFFSAPSKDISHADLQYIQGRFPIISTEKRAEQFKEHWKELFSEIEKDKVLKSCPYCGSEEYYIKQSYKGTCRYTLRFDGRDADNSEVFDYAEYKNTSKYAWCNGCNKRLFKLED